MVLRHPLTSRARHADENRQQCGHEDEAFEGLWIVAALLALNAVLFVAQPGLALPGLARKLLLRAEARPCRGARPDGGVLHDYRIDRGVIRSKADGTLTLLERDGTLVPIPVAATAAITLNGRPIGYAALRRGMVATVIWDGDAPANEVRAARR